MPKVLRPIGHEDTLSIVDHLDELRTRLVVCAGVLVVVFGICFWQNHRLLSLVNRPLLHANVSQQNHLSGVTNDVVSLRRAFLSMEHATLGLSRSATLSASDRAYQAEFGAGLRAAIKALPSKTQGTKPITIGIGEPFTTTIVVVLYFSVLIALPLILYQLYAFIIPALAPTERKVAKPIMLIAPILFIAGVVFTYFLVLPPAVKFLQGYNSSEFDSLVQASPYYKFEILTMGMIGLAFQVPLVLLGLQRAGIVTGSTLTGNWRYAILIIAVAVAALPGVDPVTMLFEMLPLVGLFLASILLLKLMDRRDAKRAVEELARAGGPDPDPIGPDPDPIETDHAL